MGVWADNQERILEGVGELADLPWPIRLVVDHEGRDTGFALLRGRIADADRAVFDEVASSHRMIGVMQRWGFPRAEYSWGGESYEVTPADEGKGSWDLPEIAACQAWTYCAREPGQYLPPNTRRFMMNLSDFVDVDAVRKAAYGPWPDPKVTKRWDVLCAYGDHWYDEISKNWSLGRRCVEILAGELGLSVLLLSRAGVPDVPDLPNVEVRPRLSWDECMGCVARSRLTLFANHLDPSPRLLTESLAADVPILVYSGLLGGWNYVQPETGRFFEGEVDLASQALQVLSTEYRTVDWVQRSCGRDRSASTFAGHLRMLGASEDLRYALPSSLFV